MKLGKRSCAAAAALALAAAACGGDFEGGGALHAQQVVLRREVQGLRDIAGRLDRGQTMLPDGDVAVAVEDSLIKDILSAQLPFDADVDRYHLSLKEAEVQLTGSPIVRLRGTLNLLSYPSILAQVNVIGALEKIEVNPATSTLTARIAIDHLGIEKAAGLEAYVSGSALDEVSRMIRLRIKDQLPPVQIPVRRPADDRPAGRHQGTGSDRRGEAAAQGFGLASRRRAGHPVDRGQRRSGAIVKTADAPEAGETTAEEAGVSLAEDGGCGRRRRPREGPGQAAPGHGE